MALIQGAILSASFGFATVLPLGGIVCLPLEDRGYWQLMAGE
jgi:hypothetical protein